MKTSGFETFGLAPKFETNFNNVIEWRSCSWHQVHLKITAAGKRYLCIYWLKSIVCKSISFEVTHLNGKPQPFFHKLCVVEVICLILQRNLASETHYNEKKKKCKHQLLRFRFQADSRHTPSSILLICSKFQKKNYFCRIMSKSILFRRNYSLVLSIYFYKIDDAS